MAFSSCRVATREQTEGIITGVRAGSMRSSRKVERCGHEAQQEDDERAKRCPSASWVERRWIVDGSDTKKTDGEQQATPDVPALPELEKPKEDKAERKQDGHVAVEADADRTKDMAAIELGRRKKIERSGKETDPGGAADRVNQESAGGDAGMEQRRE